MIRYGKFAISLLVVFVVLVLSLIAPVLASAADENCFSIVVGKNVSADGYVIMAHNEDDWPPQVVNHTKVSARTHEPGAMITLTKGGQLPQVVNTLGYLWSEMPGFLFSDSYLNERGVCICSDACLSREDNPDLTDGGISYYLRRLVAERATTAREGVLLAGRLVEQFGYDGSGRTYVISDPNEGWLMSVVNGKHWVAKRVPDDEVALIANSYTIHEVDLSDTDNYLASEDIISYAIGRGWYNPVSESSFDFARVYSDPEVAIHPTNIGRQWSAINQVAADPPAYGDPLPFSVKPKKNMTPGHVMAILADHYENTGLYEVDSVGNPHQRSFRPICRYDTQTSFVAQLRGDLPADIGLVYWCAIGSPCASIYVPFYYGINEFPSAYRNDHEIASHEEYLEILDRPVGSGLDNAFWTFSRIRNLVAADYARLAPSLRANLDELQAKAIAEQATFETAALDFYKVDKNAMTAMFESLAVGYYKRTVEKATEILESSSIERVEETK